jgi:hypothetical protein
LQRRCNGQHEQSFSLLLTDINRYYRISSIVRVFGDINVGTEIVSL